MNVRAQHNKPRSLWSCSKIPYIRNKPTDYRDSSRPTKPGNEATHGELGSRLCEPASGRESDENYITEVNDRCSPVLLAERRQKQRTDSQGEEEDRNLKCADRTVGDVQVLHNDVDRGCEDGACERSEETTAAHNDCCTDFLSSGPGLGRQVNTTIRTGNVSLREDVLGCLY
jgi:hypothetical protein